ncbi:MAG TPA: prolyl oligopeptidase family serine peptidase, partial [Vicinamibacterales bacterium]|nr:prolyl oligopeptidase family serine peptidase [Vicinamibacterales bacterium]
VRAPDKDGKPQPPQLFVLDTAGGEARQITDVARGAGGATWSPDGKSIAFTASTGPAEPTGDGHHTDVKVITKAVYRVNGNPGWLDTEHHSHIFVMRAPADAADKAIPEQITDGEFDEGGITWSPDSSKIYFTSIRSAEPYYDEAGAEIFTVARSGGATTKIAAIEGNIGNISVSPDGRQIAFVGEERGKPIRSYSQPDLWVTNATPNSTPRNLTANYDFDIDGGIGGDQSAPRGGGRKPIVWSPDSTSVIVSSAEKGSSNLKRVNVATGKMDAISEGLHDVGPYTATPDARTLVALLSTQTNIGDLFVIGAAPKQITHVNDELFKNIQQSEPEEMWYRSFDGKQIQSWILKPPNFDPSKKYPLILEIHGGPHGAYGNVYTHEFQWMAAKGYVVLFTNPRGSTSYGQEFGNIIQYHYPGDDYKDLMAGVDEILKKGYVDANRLGVTGGSGGGLLTNWTITQTQRFKAAVAQRDIADWYGFWFTADFTLFQPTWFRKAPWEDPQDFAARSPITHVANVTTPELFILGDADYRTPPADGGEMMFRALKYRKIPTEMVRFPRENHELSRSGEPWHRVERLQHIMRWMDRWLMGQAAAATAPAAPPPPRSPEVAADRRVTFRLRAPNAKEVAVAREGSPRLPMTKTADGVWNATTDPLEPDYYGYSFLVDGARVLDSVNGSLKTNLQNPGSLLHVPGNGLPWEIADVPHGIVRRHSYRSTVAGDLRDYYVYTPPGYDANAARRYPILYLLHGMSDGADAWSSEIGRANVILDNLIARNQAKPMIVVMPLGYGAPEILDARWKGGPTDPALGKRNREKFTETLLTEVMPAVEHEYRVISDRNARAIAGLSMGGAESLSTGLNALDRFAYVASFSSGGLGSDFDATFPKLDASANAKLRVLWIACGTEDQLITANRQFKDWLTSKGVRFTSIETPGMHTWMVWRRNLAAVTPLLFQDAPQSTSR